MSNLRMDDLNDDEREEVLTRGAEATRAAIEDVRSRRGDAKLREGYNAALNRLSESYNGRIPPSALANLKREWRAKGLEVW